MSTLEAINNEIAELDEPFWDLVRRGEYDSPEARALSEKLRDLKDRRAAALSGIDEDPLDKD